MAPLNPREARALRVWAALLAALSVFDFTQRGSSTLTEANRAVRRRLGGRIWTALWAGFASWFWWHVREGEPR